MLRISVDLYSGRHLLIIYNKHKSPAMQHTLQWKKHYTLLPVLSSSGHHSDGIVCVALEVSESSFSCGWVTELQVGLTTSFRTVGHSGGVEAAGSCV